jgi:hypothetical protein
MFCLYCGTDIPEDAVFCNKCGRRQNAAADTPTTANVSVSGTMLSESLAGGSQASSSIEPVMQKAPTNPTPLVQSTPSTSSRNTAVRASSGNVVPPASKISRSLSRENLGFLIAGGGGILALLAFFFMPYIVFGIFSFTGEQIASSGSQLGGQLSGAWLLWLEPVIAATVLATAGWQIYKAANNPNEEATGRAAAGLIVLAVLTITVLLGRYVYDTIPVAASNSSFSSSYPGLASYYSSGPWIYIVSMIAVGVGGVVQVKSS